MKFLTHNLSTLLTLNRRSHWKIVIFIIIQAFCINQAFSVECSKKLDYYRDKYSVAFGANGFGKDFVPNVFPNTSYFPALRGFTFEQTFDRISLFPTWSRETLPLYTRIEKLAIYQNSDPDNQSFELSLNVHNGVDANKRVQHNYIPEKGLGIKKRREEWKECHFGTCSFDGRRPNENYRLVISGFYFQFMNGANRPMESIGIWENDGVISVSFEDKNGDDPFYYSVYYAWVPKEKLVNSEYEQAGAATENARSVVGNFENPEIGIRVLSGFRFFMYEDNTDRALSKLGFSLHEGGNQVDLFFDNAKANSESREDPLSWAGFIVTTQIDPCKISGYQ